jgi:hypothetical protein
MTLISQIAQRVLARPEQWRRGQAAYNALHELRPDLARRINGSEVDPYYRDERLGIFYQWVEDQS